MNGATRFNHRRTRINMDLKRHGKGDHNELLLELTGHTRPRLCATRACDNFVALKTAIWFCGLLCILTFRLAFAQQPDLSKVEIKTTHVAGNVYMLEGAGGNIAITVEAEWL